MLSNSVTAINHSIKESVDIGFNYYMKSVFIKNDRFGGGIGQN